MEYMPGGDLFSFIRKHREQDLPEFPDKVRFPITGTLDESRHLCNLQ